MAETHGYRPPEGYMTLGQAQARLGVSRVTVGALVREGKLQTYADPINKRVKLVKEKDVAKLRQPISHEDGQGNRAA